MATIGAPLIIPFTVGTSQIVGQGPQPIMRCRYTTDSPSNPSPTWTEITPAKFRNWAISRGRDSERQEFDSGTAAIVLDNRMPRTIDPTYNPLIRPLNRWWLYEEFSGEVHTRFKGYAQSYILDYPGGGWSDAVVTVMCADEIMVLSQQALPTTNPPRESYWELISVDNPVGHWDMNEDPAARQRIADTPVPPDPGPHLGLIQFRRRDLRKVYPAYGGHSKR